MAIDWYPPSISAAPDEFHQWSKLNKEGKPKSTETAIWVTSNNIKEYFFLGDEILRVQMVPRLPNDEPSRMNAPDSFDNKYSPRKYSAVPKYALYHIWHLAQVYMTKGEVDFALRKYNSEILRGEGSPRKGGGSRFY